MTRNIIEQRESVVRSYCRDFPAILATASGSTIKDVTGKTYIDFFAGAGALNYGHNHPSIMGPLIEYLQADGIVHALDMSTSGKIAFMESFESMILMPRGLDYKMQFTGPTGTNAVEAALKLARLYTGRTTVVSFTNAFHGVTAGALSTTGNRKFRNASGMPLHNTIFIPYDGYMEEVYAPNYLERCLGDLSSGMDLPAAVLLETVQGEGGVNVATGQWLRDMEAVCRKFGIIFVVDDIQAGCGRTGQFFSFESDGISPDIITLSKSLSGSGLPMSLVLLKPHLDIWEPGSHNGTFRGNNAAFVTAKAAIDNFWSDDSLAKSMRPSIDLMWRRLESLKESCTEVVDIRQKGLFGAIEMRNSTQADAVSASCFDCGLIVETCGPAGQVLKLLPPINTPTELLVDGFEIIEAACRKLGRQL